MEDKNLTILQHLEELRKVLIISLLALIPASCAGWFLKDRVIGLLLRPLRLIDPQFKLLVLGPADQFFVDVKLAVYIGIVLALPVIMWQLWGFVLPALKVKERRALRVIVPAAVGFFVIGVVFSYYTIFQVGIDFFFGYAGASGNVQAAYALNQYINFALGFLLPFGVIFELPILILLLTRIGIVSPRFLAANRKYVILLILIVAVIFSPSPDLASQFLMAVPMYVLYELSILASRLVVRRKSEKEEEADGD